MSGFAFAILHGRPDDIIITTAAIAAAVSDAKLRVFHLFVGSMPDAPAASYVRLDLEEGIRARGSMTDAICLLM